MINIMEDAVAGAAQVQGLDKDILKQLRGHTLEYVKTKPLAQICGCMRVCARVCRALSH